MELKPNFSFTMSVLKGAPAFSIFGSQLGEARIWLVFLLDIEKKIEKLSQLMGVDWKTRSSEGLKFSLQNIHEKKKKKNGNNR